MIVNYAMRKKWKFKTLKNQNFLTKEMNYKLAVCITENNLLKTVLIVLLDVV